VKNQKYWISALMLAFFTSCGNTTQVKSATNATSLGLPPGQTAEDLSQIDNSNLENNAPEVSLAAINGGSTASTRGYFADPVAWPLVAVHASTLPNGKVLTFTSKDPEGNGVNDYLINKNGSSADLWDPITDTHTAVNNTTQELFCSGHTLNGNGNLIVSGGNNGVVPNKSYSGAKTAFSFNASNNAWTQLPNMADGRWYPTATTLGNGEVLTTSGINEAGEALNLIPEVLSNNTWRPLTNANLTNVIGSAYPWMHVAPNGQVFNSGPEDTLNYLSTDAAGAWTNVSKRDGLYRGSGTSVMYDIGKLLVLGGGTPAISSTYTVDLNNNATVTASGSMGVGRSFLNASLLPDGSIFVNGGNTDGNLNSDANSVYSSEIWNPQTGTFAVGASAKTPRNYHSTSLLLPDGRVLTTGSRLCGTGCSLNHLDAEIYYPPYLFNKDGSGNLATRPSILAYSSVLNYNSRFWIGMRNTSNIKRVTLVRMGSTTHAFNMDQRFIEASIENRYGQNWLLLKTPQNANIAPPGYYMLSVINTAGVPSVSRIVRVR
jgi:Domain of unknown function (DUF1929)